MPSLLFSRSREPLVIQFSVQGISVPSSDITPIVQEQPKSVVSTSQVVPPVTLQPKQLVQQYTIPGVTIEQPAQASESEGFEDLSLIEAEVIPSQYLILGVCEDLQSFLSLGNIIPTAPISLAALDLTHSSLFSSSETQLLDEFEATNQSRESPDFFTTMQTTGSLLDENYIVVPPSKPQ